MQWDILDSWQENFDLDDMSLHLWVYIYPELLDVDNRKKDLTPEDFADLLLAQPFICDTSEEAFAYYLQTGELAAAPQC